MLVELRIKDFAIIDDLALSFGPGLNVFTGETGAGKSIIVDAITLILGDRASNDLIRRSKEEARVEALFDVAGCADLAGVLEEAGIECGDELLIKRVVQREGRNKIYINGSLATLVTLTEVGRRLIDIYGQSEHASLVRPEEQIEALDSFGGFGELRESMSAAYREYVGARKELDALSRSQGGDEGQRELFVHQVGEIADAALEPGEEEELRAAEERLRNSARITAAASLAEKGIYSEAGSVVERLGVFVKELREVERFAPSLSGPVEAIESSIYALEEAARTLGGVAGAAEADPGGELDRINSRLDLVEKLKRKYGAGDIDELLAKKAAFEASLAEMDGLDERKKELEGRVSKARERAALVANRLSEERGRVCAGFKERIEAGLAGLGMEDAVFETVMETERDGGGEPRLGEKGADRVVFMISTNPGEGIGPLSRIASGGELSRIMLAMKSVIAAGRVRTMVFDEIDTGVGGAMGRVVGLKLREVAAERQVLCITHLPQIAAFAERHFSVSKRTTDQGRTVTVAKVLGRAERVEEIAVMLGGTKPSDLTRSHARELLETARETAGRRAGQGSPG